MGFTDILRLLFERKTERFCRLLAALNVLGLCHFLSMSQVNTYMALTEIIPALFSAQRVAVRRIHYTLVTFLYVSVTGAFVNTYCTDTSVDTLTASGENVRPADMPFTCAKCARRVPARTHHCVLCRRCILKRDHHCFFMCACIGYHNQRYFVVFCWYMIWAGLYGTVMMAMYLQHLYSVRFDSVFCLITLLPYTLYDFFSGAYEIGFHHMYLVACLYSALTAALAAVGFFYWQLTVIFAGQTTFEARRGIHGYQGNTKWHNIRDVFGDKWFITWLIPVRTTMLGNGIYHKKVL